MAEGERAGRKLTRANKMNLEMGVVCFIFYHILSFFVMSCLELGLL